MKRRKLYIGLTIGLSIVLTFAGRCMYWQAHQGDVKSIIYLNPMQEAALSKDDFDAFEKLVSSVEKTGIRIENPEMRAGSYSYSIIYRNGKKRILESMQFTATLTEHVTLHLRSFVTSS